MPVISLAIPLVFSLNAVAAAVAGPTVGRRLAASLISASGLAMCAIFPPDIIFVRACLWLGALLLSMRMIDVLDAASTPMPARMFLALGVLDPRDMRDAPPRVRIALILRSGAFLGTGLSALFAANGLPFGPLRWFLGAATFYCGVEAIGGAATALYACVGLDAKHLQDRPYLSRTLAEFWGRRWNREVGRWLYRWCFRPLTRRGHPFLGVTAAFFWSGVIHAVPTLAVAGWRAARCMQAFFMVQGALVVMERVLGVPRWPAWGGHAWVIGVFVVTAPMFVEPGLLLMRFGPAP